MMIITVDTETGKATIDELPLPGTTISIIFTEHEMVISSLEVRAEVNSVSYLSTYHYKGGLLEAL